MSARHTNRNSQTVSIVLPPSDEFPRYLHISWGWFHVSVAMHLVPKGVVPVQVATCDDRRVRMTEWSGGGADLWVKSTSFALTTDEAQLVRAAFEPLGLIVETDSISTATLPNAAKESVCAADPLGNASGERLMSLLGSTAPEFESMFSRANGSQERAR